MPELASLSLDLDNRWSYLKTRGDTSWESLPSYLDVAVPRFLELLDKHGLRITVFVVGQDAALDKNRDALAQIPAAGHEVGNHSFHHEPWFHHYTRAQAADELERAEQALEAATGVRPEVYRGPGYSITRDVLDILVERGYLLDASTLPTFIGPVARAYYLLTSRLSRAERQDRNALFGQVRDGLRPLRPYRWRLTGGELLEVPVTTLPGPRVPFHPSYVHYLAQVDPRLAEAYWVGALETCRVTRTEPSVLLHPLDFLGAEDAPELAFFPAMKTPRDQKLALMDRLLGGLARRFEVLPMGAYARRIGSRRMAVRAPDVQEGKAA